MNLPEHKFYDDKREVVKEGIKVEEIKQNKLKSGVSRWYWRKYYVAV
jgi:hypothetical protein